MSNENLGPVKLLQDRHHDEVMITLFRELRDSMNQLTRAVALTGIAIYDAELSSEYGATNYANEQRLHTKAQELRKIADGLKNAD